MEINNDRVGLGWRPDLAAGILDHLDAIHLVEVIADDFFDVPAREVRALRTLAASVSVTLHGVGMGLASCMPVPDALLHKMARLVDEVRPESWSEHLAFVRAPALEIGHLAAPPRTRENIDGAAENIFRASKAVGRKPLMENIATLVEPPGPLSESSWIGNILGSANCDLLLDLHNVFANAINHGYRAHEFLEQIPVARIKGVHIAGGQFISAPDGSTYLLDDHRHEVPDPVFALLEEVAARSPHPLTVILERDGQYPPIAELLAEIKLAREALARGRIRQNSSAAAATVGADA
jgi:uncharacterized protein